MTETPSPEPSAPPSSETPPADPAPSESPSPESSEVTPTPAPETMTVTETATETATAEPVTVCGTADLPCVVDPASGSMDPVFVGIALLILLLAAVLVAQLRRPS